MQVDRENRSSLVFTPIGTIRSPYTDPAGMPIQPAGAQGVRGMVVVDEKYQGGLRDIEGFSRLIMIYAFHRSNGYSLEVIPFLDIVPHGVFATRAPKRPNAIGLSVVRLVAVNKSELTIEDVDILDGTPLLDIKPYVPAFDCFPDGKAGWFDTCCDKVPAMRSDRRFL
jgi:tRNA-Thr(GGU) m(6)t(6)A37 methyltransferase TsaA